MASVGNPLLKDFVFPPYDVVEARHVVPGIRSLLNQLESDLEKLEETVEPTWPKLVEPLERILDREWLVVGIVELLMAVNTTPELRNAFHQVQPDIAKFDMRVGQSKVLYDAFKSIRDSSYWPSLSDSRKRVVELQINTAILSGVSLEDDKKKRLNQIEQELRRLSQRFEENLKDANQQFEKLITDIKDLQGLPASALELAAHTAAAKGHKNANAENGPWIITLSTPSYFPVMNYARNRSLREELYRAMISRASSGGLDNTPIINRILELRLEKAKILGFNSYAEVSMTKKMATLEKAQDLLEKLRVASWDAAVQDMEDLRTIAMSQGAQEASDLNHWDTYFWSERLREEKYGINEEELRSFFPLPNVMDGLFSLVKTLFGIDIESADGLAPIWNDDVKFYCVKDSSGAPMSYFYLDPYSRPGKREGAWMTDPVSRSHLFSPDGRSARLPIAVIATNQMPPMGDKPSLMTFREVEILFHEFGHALQHMLTRQNEGLLSGNRGIEQDAKELPSLFMENWCRHRDTLMKIAKHYKTGMSLPEDIYLKLVAVRNFRAGYLTLLTVKYSILDLELHTRYIPGGAESIFDVDRRISEIIEVLPPLPESRFLCSFPYSFAYGMEAGFYTYKWAKVLSADAFSAFEEAGLDDTEALKETGRRFRETVLALGAGKHPLEVFKAFRGREPSLEPLLRHDGLLSPAAWPLA